MAINPVQLVGLQRQTPDFVGEFLRGKQAKQQADNQNRIMDMREQQAAAQQEQAEAERKRKLQQAENNYWGRVSDMLADAPPDQKPAIWSVARNQAIANGLPGVQDEMPREYQEGIEVGMGRKARLGGYDPSGGQEAPAGLREFEGMTENLSPEEKEKARRIQLGLDPRATGSAAQTIADRGTAVQVGTSEGIVQDRVTRAQKEAENATGQAKEFFGQLRNIEGNIANYQEAIRLVEEEGADTGALMGRLPSIRNAAVKLDNLQAQLGLDVIGNTTFGSLSEEELQFALRAALPTQLEGQELVDWLERKVSAQKKTADYMNNAIQFLNVPGNTLADLQAEGPGTQDTDQPQQSAQPEESSGPKFLGFE